MPYREIDSATKIQALTLVYTGYSIKKISQITGISISQIYKLRNQAEERGYNYLQNKRLKLEYILDKPHSGRPKTYTEDTEAKLVSIISYNRNGRELNLEKLAYRIGCSATTIRRMLVKQGYKKVKLIIKPGLTYNASGSI
jgi:transposase